MIQHVMSQLVCEPKADIARPDRQANLGLPTDVCTVVSRNRPHRDGGHPKVRGRLVGQELPLGHLRWIRHHGAAAGKEQHRGQCANRFQLHVLCWDYLFKCCDRCWTAPQTAGPRTIMSQPALVG
jgi:hypothetical protein